MEEQLIAKISDLMDEKLSALEDKMNQRFDKIDKRLDEHDARFDMIDKRLDEHDARFDAMDKRFDEHDKRFDQNDVKFNSINARFDHMEAFMKENFDELFKNQSVILDNQQTMKKDILFMKMHLERHDKQLMSIL